MTPPDSHLAVLRRPYLSAILAGEKTVESRLSLNRVAPFQRVDAGDRIFLKESAGPVRALAIVREARFYEIDSPAGVRELRERFNHLIGGPDAYWRSKRNARYATLLWLSGVRELAPDEARPVVPRLFGRAWLALEPHALSRSA